MSPEERTLCRDLRITPPGQQRRISKEEFVRRYPAATEHGKLSPGLFTEVCASRNAEELQCAMVVGFVFGFVPEHAGLLRELVSADWHRCHEDVVSALQKLPSEDNVEALSAATQWIPEYLQYDDSRALAVKAIWALGKVRGDAAAKKLDALANSDNMILRSNAVEQLRRRIESA